MDAQELLEKYAQGERDFQGVNLSGVELRAGATWADVIKTTIFLKDLNDFAAMNAIYAKYFDTETAPICACVGVAQLPQNALVQIECVALARHL